MDAAVGKASAKLTALLRARGSMSKASLVRSYKAHVLCLLEQGTPAWYHASNTVLRRLDLVQCRFLREIGITESDAFLMFNLAPLTLRRDVAMLGFLFRCHRGWVHASCSNMFPKAPAAPYLTRRQAKLHSCQLAETTGHTEIFARSVFGLVHAWNSLSQDAVNCPTVSAFQKFLTKATREARSTGLENFSDIFSPRATH